MFHVEKIFRSVPQFDEIRSRKADRRVQAGNLVVSFNRLSMPLTLWVIKKLNSPIATSRKTSHLFLLLKNKGKNNEYKQLLRTGNNVIVTKRYNNTTIV